MQSLPEPLKLFVLKWLNPKARLSKVQTLEGAFELMVEEAEAINWDFVADQIQRLSYDLFMETLYWKVISHKVKRRDSRRCPRCGRSGSKLERMGRETHHKTYTHHGSEHLHLDDLEALCLVCHRLEHCENGLIEAIIAEAQGDERFEWRQMSISLNDGIWVSAHRQQPAVASPAEPE
jgi:5-methylcytosine-specific restriction endonuclease McrA